MTNTLLSVVATASVVIMGGLWHHVSNTNVHDDQLDKINLIQTEISKAVPPPDVRRRLAELERRQNKVEAVIGTIQETLARIEQMLKEK